MAQPNISDARLTRIWVGSAPEGVGPPPAYKLCAMDRKAINQALNTNTAVIPDCDDPTKVVPVKRTAISKDVTVTGTGYYESERRADLQTYFDDAASKDICFEIMDPDPEPGYYKGQFYLTQFNIIGNNDEGYITCELTFEGNGGVTWTDLPPP